MDITPVIPILVEATKFLFGELGKWLDTSRKQATKSHGSSNLETPTFTKHDLAELERNPQNVQQYIDSNFVETNALTIKGLVEQLRIHIKNLNDLEMTEAQYGLLTPQHIKHGIELEKRQIAEKSENLREILSTAYGRQIDNSE